MRTGVSERGCSSPPNSARCACHQGGFALKCSHSIYPDNPKTNTFASVVPAFLRLRFKKTTCLEQRGDRSQGRFSQRSCLHRRGWKNLSCTTHFPKQRRQSRERSPPTLPYA